MNLNESGEKQANLQQALDIRASIPDMENRDRKSVV